MVGTCSLRRIGILAALALACLPLTAAAQQSRVPVLVGQDGPEFDACGTQGRVRGLDAKGDGFLAVRAGPDSSYAMVGKVHSGDVLNICDQRGSWLGVVYSHDTKDCGVGTPWPRASTYDGPCLSGWVFDKYVAGFAG